MDGNTSLIAGSREGVSDKLRSNEYDYSAIKYERTRTSTQQYYQWYAISCDAGYIIICIKQELMERIKTINRVKEQSLQLIHEHENDKQNKREQ